MYGLHKQSSAIAVALSGSPTRIIFGASSSGLMFRWYIFPSIITRSESVKRAFSWKAWTKSEETKIPKKILLDIFFDMIPSFGVFNNI